MAWHWLGQRRRHVPPNADFWHLRFHWAQHGDWLYQHLQSGYNQLAPMQVFRRGGRSWVQWCAQDALVLKWAALLVEPLLPKPARCMHLRGHGGSVASVAEVRAALISGDYAFVYRMDIRGYYRHIRTPYGGVTLTCTAPADVRIETNSDEKIPLSGHSTAVAVLDWGAGWGKPGSYNIRAGVGTTVNLRVKTEGVRNLNPGTVSGIAVVNVSYE